MQRETATNKWDLPHAFEADTKMLVTSPPQVRCRCGRRSDDELHSAQTVERAAEVTPPLERERGV